MTDSFVQRIHAELAAVEGSHTVLLDEASTVYLLSAHQTSSIAIQQNACKEDQSDRVSTSMPAVIEAAAAPAASPPYE